MGIEYRYATREFIVSENNSTSEVYKVGTNKYFHAFGPVSLETLRSQGWELVSTGPLENEQKEFAGCHCVFRREKVK
ncbi:MAG: hypothetical protein QOJ64_1497 [Acidobacteriota bacterium]|jgi:hypothetical protein|nr:hypothetical protein [Acidobacteriota bacterium]